MAPCRGPAARDRGGIVAVSQWGLNGSPGPNEKSRGQDKGRPNNRQPCLRRATPCATGGTRRVTCARAPSWLPAVPLAPVPPSLWRFPAGYRAGVPADRANMAARAASGPKPGEDRSAHRAPRRGGTPYGGKPLIHAYIQGLGLLRHFRSWGLNHANPLGSLLRASGKPQGRVVAWTLSAALYGLFHGVPRAYRGEEYTLAGIIGEYTPEGMRPGKGETSNSRYHPKTPGITLRVSLRFSLGSL